MTLFSNYFSKFFYFLSFYYKMPNYRAGNPMPPQTMKTKKGMKTQKEYKKKKKLVVKKKKPMGLRKTNVSY